MSVFETYWRVAGLPLSRLKGLVVDRLPFSLVEVLLWTGGAATLLWALSWIKPLHRWSRPRRRLWLFLLGPVLLLVQAFCQGVAPIGLDPTAWRCSLTRAFGTDSLSDESFKSWAKERQQRLNREFDWQACQSVSEEEALTICNRSLDSVLVDLDLPPGRTVRKAKDMGPLSTVVALAYGGPAYHDPLTDEVALASIRDDPEPHYWRLITICHEVAHAKGFSRELDAEVLTQLALLRMHDPSFRALADLHFLGKSGLGMQWPDSLVSEWRRVKRARLALEGHQPVITWLRGWAKKGHVQNSGQKYGTREAGQKWNPRQPFFATVHRLQKRVEGPVAE